MTIDHDYARDDASAKSSEGIVGAQVELPYSSQYDKLTLALALLEVMTNLYNSINLKNDD